MENKKTNLPAKIAYNTLIQFIAKIFTTLLGLAAIAVITRYLGAAGFGQYTTVVTFLSFFAVMADWGLTLVTVQMINRPDLPSEKTLNNLFSFRLVLAVLFLGLAPLAALLFPYEAAIKIAISLAVFSSLFTILNQIFVGLLQTKLWMDKAALAEIASRLVLLAGTGAAVYFKTGLNGIIIAGALASFANLALHYFFSSRFIRPRWQFDFDLWKKIISHSWPLAVTIILNLMYLRTDILVLSLLKTPREVGIYGAAYRVIDVATALPFMFAGVILPLLTSAWAAGEKEKFKKILLKSLEVLAILAFPLAVGTQFVAGRLMVLVAGPEFAAAGPVLKLLIWGAMFIFLGCIFSHAVIALDKQKKIILAYLFTALSSVAGYLIFIPKYSYTGAAWVTIYSEFFIAAASFWLVYRLLKFSPNFLILGKSLLASLVMGAALYFLKEINLFLLIAGGATVYFISLYALGGISRQDLLIFFNGRKKIL